MFEQSDQQWEQTQNEMAMFVAFMQQLQKRGAHVCFSPSAALFHSFCRPFPETRSDLLRPPPCVGVFSALSLSFFSVGAKEFLSDLESLEPELQGSECIRRWTSPRRRATPALDAVYLVRTFSSDERSYWYSLLNEPRAIHLFRPLDPRLSHQQRS